MSPLPGVSPRRFRNTHGERKTDEEQTFREQGPTLVECVRGRVLTSAAGGRRLCQVTGRSSNSEGEIRNGQLGSADFGIRPGAPGRHWVDHRHHPASVEDVRLRWRQHHHRGRHVRGTLDVLRLPEHRTDPV